MTILPLTYLGNTEYFAQLLRGDCVIDLYEHYVKQSYRNRCEIVTAGGVASLTVHVVKGGSMIKKPIRDMRIDYSKRWQHQHWVSIVSAYKNSPYFDHYGELFEPLYRKEFEFLTDLNIGLMETILKILGNPIDLHFSQQYVEPQEEDTDLRSRFKPASPAISPQDESRFAPYEQVFSDRLPFQPNLSIADLLFCEGPQAVEYLRAIPL